jgi:prophage regulatory protein
LPSPLFSCHDLGTQGDMIMPDNVRPERILRVAEVSARTGLARSSIYMHMQAHEFPKQIHLSVNSVGWLESEINEWMAKRIAESRRLPP